MAKKAKKLTKDELEQVKSVVSSVNQLTAQIGNLEIQKSKALQAFAKAESQLAEEQKILEDKYGSVNVSLEDGTLTETEE